MIEPDEWSPAGDLSLEPNAAKTIKSVRHVALTAGPGSGKTEVLAQRCDYLLRTGLCPYPRRILAISAKRDARTNLANRVRGRCGEALADRLDSYTFHAFAKSIIDRFHVVLTGANALPHDYRVGKRRIVGEQIRFEDMIPLAHAIVNSNLMVLRAIRRTYSFVLLDEFQDCTDPQYRLVEAIFGDSSTLLTAVGDTKQGIMRWAGAVDGIFDRFVTDFDALGLNLYINRRSDVRLRRMQNEMVKVIDPEAVVPDSELKGSEGIATHLHFEGEVDEALHLAEIVKSWINDEGIRPSEIAILFSKQTEFYGPEIVSHLRQFDVPLRDENALQDLVKEPLFNLLNDFLRVVFGSGEAQAYSRLVRTLVPHDSTEKREFVLRTHWALYFSNAARNCSLQDLHSDASSVVASFINELGESFLRNLSPEYAAGDFFEKTLQECHDNLRAAATRARDVEGFLAALDDDNSVKMMTIHKSKGLEFHSVVIVGIESETFWGKFADEQAAFFVGISRAKKRLVLTTAERRSRPPDAWKWNVERTQHGSFLGYLYRSANDPA